jgi:hypothetical protein
MSHNSIKRAVKDFERNMPTYFVVFDQIKKAPESIVFVMNKRMRVWKHTLKVRVFVRMRQFENVKRPGYTQALKELVARIRKAVVTKKLDSNKIAKFQTGLSHCLENIRNLTFVPLPL